MADNVTVINGSGNSGSDYVIGSDEVGGVQYQIIKNAYGADGTVTQVTDGGANALSGLPVRIVRTSNAPTESFTTSTTTSVALIASNASRLGWEVQNNADKILYLSEGATATSAKTRVLPGETARNTEGVVYTGAINGIWESSPTGNAVTREYT